MRVYVDAIHSICGKRGRHHFLWVNGCFGDGRRWYGVGQSEKTGRGGFDALSTATTGSVRETDPTIIFPDVKNGAGEVEETTGGMRGILWGGTVRDGTGEPVHDDSGVGETGAREIRVPPPKEWGMHGSGMSGMRGSIGADPYCGWAVSAAASVMVVVQP